MDNIRYGKPEATEQEVIEAAKNANAHEFIMSLPDSYLTDIGQRGVKLVRGPEAAPVTGQGISEKSAGINFR